MSEHRKRRRRVPLDAHNLMATGSEMSNALLNPTAEAPVSQSVSNSRSDHFSRNENHSGEKDKHHTSNAKAAEDDEDDDDDDDYDEDEDDMEEDEEDTEDEVEGSSVDPPQFGNFQIEVKDENHEIREQIIAPKSETTEHHIDRRIHYIEDLGLSKDIRFNKSVRHKNEDRHTLDRYFELNSLSLTSGKLQSSVLKEPDRVRNKERPSDKTNRDVGAKTKEETLKPCESLVTSRYGSQIRFKMICKPGDRDREAAELFRKDMEKAQSRQKESKEAEARRKEDDKMRTGTEDSVRKKAEERKGQVDERERHFREHRVGKEAEEKSRKEAERGKDKNKTEEKVRKEAEEKVRKEAGEKAKKEQEEKARKEAAEKYKKETEQKAIKEAQDKIRKEVEEKAKKEAEEKARREAAEKIKKESEEKARKESQEKSKKEAEEKAKKEREEIARKAAAEKHKKEAEEKARKEALEKIRREAEEKNKKETEEKARKEAVEKIKKEAEEKAKKELQEKIRKEAEAKVKKEKAEQERREAAEKAKKEAEQKSKTEAIEKSKKEAEEKSKKELEEKQRREASEKMKKEAEEKTRKETQEKARKEVEEKSRREEEEKTRREAAEKMKKEAEEKLKKEAHEKAIKQAEEKAKKTEEEKTRKEAAEKLKKESDERARQEAQEKAKKEAVEKSKKETEEKLRKETAEKRKKEAEEKAIRESQDNTRKEAEIKAKKEREEEARLGASGKMKKEAEDKIMKEAQEKTRKEAEVKARKEAEEKTRKEAAEKVKKETQEKAKKGAHEKARAEAEERLKKETEEKIRKESAERNKKEVEMKSRTEAREKAREEAEINAKKETEEKTRRESVEKLKKEGGEKARKEAQEKTRKDAEEKSKKVIEEKTRKEAAEEIKRKAEDKARKEQQEKARKEAETKMKKEYEEKSRREAAEKTKKEADEKTRKESQEKVRKEAQKSTEKDAAENLRKESAERNKKELEEKNRKEAQEKTRKDVEEKGRKETEEKARRGSAEKLKKEAEEKTRKEAHENAGKEAEEQAKKEAKEKIRKETAEKVKKEVDERNRMETQEKARKESEDKQKKEIEEKARKEGAEKAKKITEEKTRKEAQDKSRNDAEEKVKKEAEEKERKEYVEKMKKQTEETSKIEAQEKAKKEADGKVKKDAEEKARKEAADKVKQEADDKGNKQAQEKARKDAEERAKQETQEKARKEAAEKIKKEVEEKTKKEAQEKAKKESEEKVKKETEEKARKEAAEKLKKEAEEKAKKEAQEKMKKESDEKTKIETEEKARKEAAERVKKGEQEKSTKDSQEKAKKETEKKIKKEAEETIRKQAAEKVKQEAEERGKKEAQEKMRKEADSKSKKETEEKARKEAAESLKKEAEEKLRKEAQEKTGKTAEEKTHKSAERERGRKEATDKSRRDEDERASVEFSDIVQSLLDQLQKIKEMNEKNTYPTLRGFYQPPQAYPIYYSPRDKKRIFRFLYSTLGLSYFGMPDQDDVEFDMKENVTVEIEKQPDFAKEKKFPKRTVSQVMSGRVFPDEGTSKVAAEELTSIIDMLKNNLFNLMSLSKTNKEVRYPKTFETPSADETEGEEVKDKADMSGKLQKMKQRPSTSKNVTPSDRRKSSTKEKSSQGQSHVNKSAEEKVDVKEKTFGQEEKRELQEAMRVLSSGALHDQANKDGTGYQLGNILDLLKSMLLYLLTFSKKNNDNETTKPGETAKAQETKREGDRNNADKSRQAQRMEEAPSTSKYVTERDKNKVAAFQDNSTPNSSDKQGKDGVKEMEGNKEKIADAKEVRQEAKDKKAAGQGTEMNDQIISMDNQIVREGEASHGDEDKLNPMRIIINRAFADIFKVMSKVGLVRAMSKSQQQSEVRVDSPKSPEENVSSAESNKLATLLDLIKSMLLNMLTFSAASAGDKKTLEASVHDDNISKPVLPAAASVQDDNKKALVFPASVHDDNIKPPVFPAKGAKGEQSKDTYSRSPIPTLAQQATAKAFEPGTKTRDLSDDGKQFKQPKQNADGKLSNSEQRKLNNSNIVETQKNAERDIADWSGKPHRVDQTPSVSKHVAVEDATNLAIGESEEPNEEDKLIIEEDKETRTKLQPTESEWQNLVKIHETKLELDVNDEDESGTIFMRAILNRTLPTVVTQATKEAPDLETGNLKHQPVVQPDSTESPETTSRTPGGKTNQTQEVNQQNPRSHEVLKVASKPNDTFKDFQRTSANERFVDASALPAKLDKSVKSTGKTEESNKHRITEVKPGYEKEQRFKGYKPKKDKTDIQTLAEGESPDDANTYGSRRRSDDTDEHQGSISILRSHSIRMNPEKYIGVSPVTFKKAETVHEVSGPAMASSDEKTFPVAPPNKDKSAQDRTEEPRISRPNNTIVLGNTVGNTLLHIINERSKLLKVKYPETPLQSHVRDDVPKPVRKQNMPQKTLSPGHVRSRRYGEKTRFKAIPTKLEKSYFPNNKNYKSAIRHSYLRVAAKQRKAQFIVTRPGKISDDSIQQESSEEHIGDPTVAREEQPVNQIQTNLVTGYEAEMSLEETAQGQNGRSNVSNYGRSVNEQNDKREMDIHAKQLITENGKHEKVVYEEDAKYTKDVQGTCPGKPKINLDMSKRNKCILKKNNTRPVTCFNFGKRPKSKVRSRNMFTKQMTFDNILSWEMERKEPEEKPPIGCDLFSSFHNISDKQSWAKQTHSCNDFFEELSSITKSAITIDDLLKPLELDVSFVETKPKAVSLDDALTEAIGDNNSKPSRYDLLGAKLLSSGKKAKKITLDSILNGNCEQKIHKKRCHRNSYPPLINSIKKGTRFPTKKDLEIRPEDIENESTNAWDIMGVSRDKYNFDSVLAPSLGCNYNNDDDPHVAQFKSDLKPASAAEEMEFFQKIKPKQRMNIHDILKADCKVPHVVKRNHFSGTKKNVKSIIGSGDGSLLEDYDVGKRTYQKRGCTYQWDRENSRQENECQLTESEENICDLLGNGNIENLDIERCDAETRFFNRIKPNIKIKIEDIMTDAFQSISKSCEEKNNICLSNNNAKNLQLRLTGVKKMPKRNKLKTLTSNGLVKKKKKNVEFSLKAKCSSKSKTVMNSNPLVNLRRDVPSSFRRPNVIHVIYPNGDGKAKQEIASKRVTSRIDSYLVRKLESGTKMSNIKVPTKFPNDHSESTTTENEKDDEAFLASIRPKPKFTIEDILDDTSKISSLCPTKNNVENMRRHIFNQFWEKHCFKKRKPKSEMSHLCKGDTDLLHDYVFDESCEKDKYQEKIEMECKFLESIKPKMKIKLEDVIPPETAVSETKEIIVKQNPYTNSKCNECDCDDMNEDHIKTQSNFFQSIKPKLKIRIDRIMKPSSAKTNRSTILDKECSKICSVKICEDYKEDKQKLGEVAMVESSSNDAQSENRDNALALNVSQEREFFESIKPKCKINIENILPKEPVIHSDVEIRGNPFVDTDVEINDTQRINDDEFLKSIKPKSKITIDSIIRRPPCTKTDKGIEGDEKEKLRQIFKDYWINRSSKKGRPLKNVYRHPYQLQDDDCEALLNNGCTLPPDSEPEKHNVFTESNEKFLESIRPQTSIKLKDIIPSTKRGYIEPKRKPSFDFWDRSSCVEDLRNQEPIIDDLVFEGTREGNETNNYFKGNSRSQQQGPWDFPNQQESAKKDKVVSESKPFRVHSRTS